MAINEHQESTSHTIPDKFARTLFCSHTQAAAQRDTFPYSCKVPSLKVQQRHMLANRISVKARVHRHPIQNIGHLKEVKYSERLISVLQYD